MKYDGTNLKEVLEAHKRWLEESEGWTEDDRAYLSGADLSGTNNVPYIPLACPSDGAFTAWKKARLRSGAVAIIKLLIPEDAKRLSATGRKCRCDKAQVLEIWSLDTGFKLKDRHKEAKSAYDSEFIYREGETVSVDDFDEDRWIECSKGIHFFIDMQEAIDY